MDRLLSQLQYEGKAVAQLSSARQPASTAARPWGAPPSAVSVWGRVVVGAALAVAMTRWPYAHACGLALASYLTAVAGVLLVGAWAAHAAWRARIGLAHLAALAIVFASAALAAVEVMPRMGYAPTDVAWRCSAERLPNPAVLP